MITVSFSIRHNIQEYYCPDAGFTAETETIPTSGRPRRQRITSSKLHPQIAIHYIGILGWLRSMGEPLWIASLSSPCFFRQDDILYAD